MGRTRYVEIYCDNCNQGDYYKPGNVDGQARKNGWIITRDRKDFCSKECKEEYRKKKSN